MSVPSAVDAATPPGDRGARRLRIAGSALAAILLGVGTASVIAGFFEQQEVRSYPLTAGVHGVSVATNVGDIQVRAATPGEQPRLITTLRWSYQQPVVAVKGPGERPVVEARCQAVTGPGCGVDVTLIVPATTELHLASDVGRIQTRGMTGALTAVTSVGDVRLSELGSAPIRVTTDAGAVVISVVSPDARITARTSTGDVTLNFSAPPEAVTAVTEAGDVAVRVPPGATYQVWADSDLGTERVSVASDPGSTRNLTATTSTGDVTIATVGG